MLKKKSFFYWFTIHIVALLLLCTTLLAGMSGCNKKTNNDLFSTEFFNCEYYQHDNKMEICIRELTEKGKMQKAIVIPSKINGISVKYLGSKENNVPYYHVLQSDYLKKIYIEADVATMMDSVFQKLSSELVVVFVNETFPQNISTSAFPYGAKIVINKKNEKEADVFDYHIKNNNISIEYANVFYFLENNDKEKPYWIDYFEIAGTILLPPEPTKEGKTFLGWVDADGQEWTGESASVVFPLELMARWN